MLKRLGSLLQTEFKISESTQFLLGAVGFFLLPSIARFLRAAGFRQVGLALVDHFAWVVYLVGILFLLASASEFRSRFKRDE